MLARFARMIGVRLALALEMSSDAAERAAFALENIFLFLLTLGAIILSAALCGLFWPAVVASATGAIMRKASGGAHLGGPWRCILVSTVLALLLGLAGRIGGAVLTLPVMKIVAGFVFLGGLLLLLLYAPAATPAKPIPPRQGAVLKGLSVIFLVLWTVGSFTINMGRELLGASMAGMVWQLWTITPAGYSLYHIIDGLWAKGGERECASSC